MSSWLGMVSVGASTNTSATRCRLRSRPLIHGDVMVWGGPDRLTFHGVHFLAEGEHPLTGGYRFNFTFRRAL